MIRRGQDGGKSGYERLESWRFSRVRSPLLLTRDSCYTKLVCMKNVTVTLDEETARWARIEAARREMSVSSFIRQLLRERMGGQVAYAGAKGRYLSRAASDISGGRGYPTREELHERAGLR